MRYSALGDNEFSKVRFIPEIDVIPFDHGDFVANVIDIPVESGTYIMDVGVQLTEGLGSSSGSVIALNIGDGTTANLYLKFADLTTSGSAAQLCMGSRGTTLFKGKYYVDAGMIRMTSGSAMDSGAGNLLVQYFKSTRSWRESMPH